MRFAEERSSKLLRAVDASGLNLKMTTNVDFIRDLDILCFLILFFLYFKHNPNHLWAKNCV